MSTFELHLVPPGLSRKDLNVQSFAESALHGSHLTPFQRNLGMRGGRSLGVVYVLPALVWVLPKGLVLASSADPAQDHQSSGGMTGTPQASVTDCGLQGP